MDNRQDASESTSHPGGNPEFWRDELVRAYDHHQSLVSEKKEEVLNNMTRIFRFFCNQHSTADPKVLDVGCGPGTLSTRILDQAPDAVVVGVDVSDQMIAASNRNLVPKYGRRFSGHVSDFNSDDFWIPEIDRKYDFVVSSIALHYLSDQRRIPFFKEVLDHLKANGSFIACIANRSDVREIAEMEAFFRAEFTHQQLEKQRGPQDFGRVVTKCAEEDARANINWRSQQEYLASMRSAGFAKADIVWRLWLKSIFVATR